MKDLLSLSKSTVTVSKQGVAIASKNSFRALSVKKKVDLPILKSILLN